MKKVQVETTLLCTLIFLAGAITSVSSAKMPAAYAQDTLKNFSLYTNSDFGLKIKYPSDWIVAEGNVAIVSFYPNSSADSSGVSIVTETIPPNIDLDEYVQSGLNQLEKSYNNFQVIESRKVTLAGMPAQQLVYTVTQGGFEFQIMQTITLRQETAYIVTYSAEKQNYDAYLTVAQTMTESFQVGQFQEDIEMLRYQEDANGISINYPSNWSINNNTQGQVMFISPDSDAVIIINYQNIFSKDDVALGQFTESSVEGLKKVITLFRIESNSTATLTDRPAYKIVYTGSQQLFGDTLTQVKVMQIWTVIEGRAYVFTYEALEDRYPEYLSAVNEMASSLKVDAAKIPKKVIGQYVDDNIGLKMKLPESWVGFKTTYQDRPLLMVIPSSIAQNATIDNNNLSMIMVFDSNFEDIVSGQIPTDATSAGNIQSSSKCQLPTSMKIIKINNMKAFHFSENCNSDDTGKNIKLEMYAIRAGQKLIVVAYAGTSDSAFEANYQNFQKSINTLEVENPTDLSELLHLAHMLGGKQIKQTVMVDGKPYDVNIATSSKISGFNLDQVNKQASFTVEGEDGTTGSTVIEIGNILQGPYIISMDGNVLDDGYMVIEDNTTNQTSIELQYSHSMHKVTIQGVNVVPEFPSAPIGLIITASIVGLIAVSWRNRGLLHSP